MAKAAKGGRLTCADYAVLDSLLRESRSQKQQMTLTKLSRKLRRDRKTVKKMLAERARGRSRSAPRKPAKRKPNPVRSREVIAIRALLRRRNSLGEKPFGTYSRLRAGLAEKGVHLSRSQLRRRCAALQIKSRIRPACPTVDPEKHVKIRAFCRKTLRWATDEKKLRKIVACDEWPGTTNDCSERSELLVPGESVRPRTRKRRFPDHSIQAWVCIAFSWKKIVFAESRSARHNSRSYRETCLKPVLRRLQGSLFLQDGAKCHWGNTSSKTDDEGPMPESNRQWLYDNQIETIEPPVDAPNLNPAENAFSVLNKAVSARRGEIHSAADMKRVMKEEFDRLDQDFVRKCILAFPAKVKLALKDPALAGSNHSTGVRKRRQE